MKFILKQQKFGSKIIKNKHFLLLTFLPILSILYIVKKLKKEPFLTDLEIYVNNAF